MRHISPTRKDPIGFSSRPKTRGVSPYKTNGEALIANSKQVAKIRKMSRRSLTRQVVGPHKKYFDESLLTDMQRAIHRAKVKIWLEGEDTLSTNTKS